MAASAAQSVRDALRTWALELVADVLPAATVEGGPVEAGAAPSLPTLGLDWGATTVEASRPTDVEEENDETTGQGVWLLHYESVQMGFVWRATTPEDADLFAHEFATRAALAAVRSNGGGNRVLHFGVSLGDDDRTAKLYLSGEVVPERRDENVTRSLYTYRVPGSVSYPVYAVESESDATGLMAIVVTINGTSYELAEIVEA